MSYHEREYRATRYKDDSDDDEKYKSTTVRRYKVGGSAVGGPTTRVERVKRYEDYDDDRKSTYSHRDDFRDSHSHVGRRSGELVEVDKRVEKTYYPERPRSAFDPPVQRTVVEKRVVEREGSDFRDRDRDRDDRYRVVERDVDYTRGDSERRERDIVFEREPERRDTIVRETRETIERERDSPLSPRDRDWDRRSRMPWDDRDDVRVEKRVERRTEEHGDHVDDVRVEKRIERRSDDRVDDVKVEKRIERFHDDDHHHHHHHDGDIERYRKETEYYAPADPTPQPIVIRQKPAEPQQIIVQEAPPPPPVFIERQTDPGYIVLRENNREVARPRPDPREEEYYYRREERRDDDYAMERYQDRRRRDYDDDEDVYMKRTIIRRERSTSSDHHRRRHLAEGALAGAGISALVASRRGADGDIQESRGKKVLAGAALGALGTEVIRRARSAYEDRHEDDYEDDYRRGGRSKSRSRLTTGLAIVSWTIS